jgi:hypothetical protein
LRRVRRVRGVCAGGGEDGVFALTQEKESRRHGIPEESEVTPATTAETVVEPDSDLREALPESDLITKDDGSGMAGGASGSSAGGSGMKGHPDYVDEDKVGDLERPEADV